MQFKNEIMVMGFNNLYTIKGTLTDSNNNFLWYELIDVNKKAYFQTHVDSNFIFSSYASMIMCVKVLRLRLSVKIALISY